MITIFVCVYRLQIIYYELYILLFISSNDYTSIPHTRHFNTSLQHKSVMCGIQDVWKLRIEVTDLCSSDEF